MTRLAPAQTRTPAPAGPRTAVLRRCACGGRAGPSGECQECRAKRLGVQRSASSPAAPSIAPPLVHDVLRSPGRPLDAGTRAYMEPRFGHSFADVRIHADEPAAESAAAVSAHAYTVGRDVVFGAGRYAPGSAAGRRLIAHELAHVVQQSAGGIASLQPRLEIGAVDAPEERAADAAADAVVSGGVAPAKMAGGGMRLRRQFGEEDPVHTGQGERWRTGHGLPASDADGSATGYSDAIVKYRMTGCAQPGSARQVTLQPVFFRTGPADPSPTGATWAGRFAAAVPIWRKLGVTLTAASPVTLDDAVNKTAGSDTAERHRVRDQLMGPDIEVFLVDNDVATMGGGATRFGGSANAQIIMADRGASSTLLAHEVGHVLGLGHPPAGADAGTVMATTSSHSVDNPTRNTLGNYRRITWPLPVVPTCIHPDP